MNALLSPSVGLDSGPPVPSVLYSAAEIDAHVVDPATVVSWSRIVAWLESGRLNRMYQLSLLAEASEAAYEVAPCSGGHAFPIDVPAAMEPVASDGGVPPPPAVSVSV